MMLLWTQLCRPSCAFLSKRIVAHLRTCRWSSSKSHDPLRILFCGSDEFSELSLRALHNHHLGHPESIASIDVVSRTPKRVGRGLKQLQETRISSVAEELRLPLHKIDTFTGWKPPSAGNEPINLIVAVSFGRFVPSRILIAAKYGGLNVHPSFLPDLRGSAPIQRAILAGDTHFGVSLQTLHHERFDHGTILAQTPLSEAYHLPQMDEHASPRLVQVLGEMGATMLVGAIEKGLFVPPLEDVGSSGQKEGNMQLRLAPKITPADSAINWVSNSVTTIRNRLFAIGSVWDEVTYGCCDPMEEQKRTNFSRLLFTKCAIEKGQVEPFVPSVFKLESPAGGSVEKAEVAEGGIVARISPPHKQLFTEKIDNREVFVILSPDQMNTTVDLIQVIDCTVAGQGKNKGKTELIRLWKKKYGEPRPLYLLTDPAGNK